MNNLKKWMQPQPVERNLVRPLLVILLYPTTTFKKRRKKNVIVIDPTPVESICFLQSTTLDECRVVHEPVGVVFIRGSWCSPVQMCLVPLLGAIAAGNCAILSPSEWAAHTAELLHRLVPFYLDNECFHVILEGVNDLPEVFELKFDHIFFAGNREDGGKVAESAAHTLTPVTLIIGGKNPCYVDRECDIGTTAQRLVWARFHNAGQSLVAPGYVLCHAQVKARLVQAMKSCLIHFYGSDPRESKSFGRLINLEVFNRVKDLLWRSGKVAVGGQVVEAEKYIAPTILTEVTESDLIMHQEVFGPVLPILTVNDVDEAITFINKQEKALCVYAYSTNTKIISRLMSETSSGSFCSNDSILQSLMVTLPFGGVGASGMGSFHGRYSFDAFSHRKSCLLRSARLECVTYLRYPPYEDHNLSLIAWAKASNLHHSANLAKVKRKSLSLRGKHRRTFRSKGTAQRCSH
uniref:Aldehyde dehydrogenase n=1 Tax=Gouania willdenowi TaxID=441366 RepID=A0A8C5H965_GOUWI